MSNYILKDKNVIKIDNVLEWAQEFEKLDRVISKTKIGDILVSTVFLGVDLSYGKGDIEVFETMIFGIEEDSYQERFATYEKSIKGHNKAIQYLKNYLKTNN